MKLKIFLSYSWKNSAYREALASRISIAGHEPFWDQRAIPIGDSLHQGIITLLNESDIVIALLTSESIESRAVLEELTRAHHQSLRIYAVVHQSVVSKLPWFLHVPVFLQFGSDSELLDMIDKVLRRITADSDFIVANGIHRLIQEHHRYADDLLNRSSFGTPEGRWSHEIATTILNNTRDELKALTGDYKAIVSTGVNFLMRAKPVFERASRIFAVSLDKVSSFWVSRETADQGQARDYLAAHPSQTMRLFVFSNPDSAHNYTTVLNIHARRYGTEGRVFLCSGRAYEQLVEKWATTTPDRELMKRRDFAVLEYSCDNGSITCRATFDQESFVVTRTENKRLSPYLDDQEIRQSFEELATLAPREIHNEYQVMRWDVDLQKETDDWVKRLRVLFGERESDVLHMVFFSRDAFSTASNRDKLEKSIDDVKRVLEEIIEDGAHRIQLKQAWFGKNHTVAARDCRTGGRIINDESSLFPYVLLMRFKDERSLKEWYEFDKHSDLRRRVFEAFNHAGIGDLFTSIDTTTDREKVESIYEEIERKAAQFIIRRDYREADTITDIVKRPAFRPKFKFEF